MLVCCCCCCCCCCCFWRADSKTSVLNEVFLPKKAWVFDGFPNFCYPERWSRLNRRSHPDWVKSYVDPNGRIKLRTKQKYEILSVTYPLSFQGNFKTCTLWLKFIKIKRLISFEGEQLSPYCKVKQNNLSCFVLFCFCCCFNKYP